MSNREQLAAIVALMLGGLFGFLLSGAAYGFICGAGILGFILPVPVCLIADRRNILWAMAANSFMLVCAFAIAFVRKPLGLSDLGLILAFLGGVLIPVGCFVGAIVASFIDALRRARQSRREERADIDS